AQEALGARGEQERESELACRFDRGGDALGRLADVEQGLVLTASGRGVLFGRHTASCRSESGSAGTPKTPDRVVRESGIGGRRQRSIARSIGRVPHRA